VAKHEEEEHELHVPTVNQSRDKDGIKGGTSGLRSCLKGLSLNAFAFEPMEEAFHGRMIITVRRPTHACSHALLTGRALAPG
jgi:hypothetical protein